MRKVIIITGHLAALKSTISKSLSSDFKIVVLNKDTIKEVLGDTIGFSNREDNLKLSKATFEMIKFLMLQFINVDQDVIIESNFKKHELESLKQMIDDYQMSSYTLFLTGDSETLYQRYVSRQETRHPVHQSTGLLSYDVFKKVMDEYHHKECFGIVEIIDTTHFNVTLYDELKHKIKSFLS